MSRLIAMRMLRRAFLFTLCCSLSLAVPEQITAQRRASSRRSSSRRRRTPAPLPSAVPLPASVDPFAALQREANAGETLDINFNRTELDKKATATAQVALRDQTLMVRVRAKDIPSPSVFGVPRYALWVYVPNHQVKMYIGDLPVTLTSKDRGESDSAYRFTALPRGAIFGGLMLTAEPVRYTPIVSEALRPVLVALVPEVDPKNVGAAIALYAGPPYVNAGTYGGAPAVPPQATKRPTASPKRLRKSNRRP